MSVIVRSPSLLASFLLLGVPFGESVLFASVLEVSSSKVAPCQVCYKRGERIRFLGYRRFFDVASLYSRQAFKIVLPGIPAFDHHVVILFSLSLFAEQLGHEIAYQSAQTGALLCRHWRFNPIGCSIWHGIPLSVCPVRIVGNAMIFY